MSATDNPDVVIVGAGISGAIMAYELARNGKSVVILEAGPVDPDSRQTFQKNFLTSFIQLPECPYPPYELTPSRLNAPRANSRMLFNWPKLSATGEDRRRAIAQVNEESHLTYPLDGVLPFMSTYERLRGGTTWHWLGTALRLIPNDFRVRTLYGWGIDWPIGYDDLADDYARAEREIGVSADVKDQAYLGIHFPDVPPTGGTSPQPYAYPMPPIPMSYSDQQLDKGMQGLSLDWLGGLAPRMAPTAQGRNSNSTYNGRRQCQGNTSCIPFCPIGAKYDATVTLQNAVNTGRVTIIPQAVATRINVDGATRRVTSIDYTIYQDQAGGPLTRKTISAGVFVIAAHAIETARLLLLSAGDVMPNGVANTSDQVGRNLMDHVCYLGWGLATDPVYPFRGPRSSGGVETLRDGAFRKDFAAFRIDVGNEGWGWADGDPFTAVTDFVEGSNASGLNTDSKKLFGADLVAHLNDSMTRMVRFCYLVEQTPDPKNRVTLSATYRDGLDLPRPEIRYGLSDYTLEGFVSAERTTDAIFRQAKIKNFTKCRDEAGYPSVSYTARDGTKHSFNCFGAGHIVGTYRMGADPHLHVVTGDLRTHDHANLYLLGSGTFPTIGTANPTLTVAALAFRASRAVLATLKNGI